MRLSTVLLASVCLAACAPSARLPFASGVGPDPALPPPAVETIPAVDVGAAVGWAPGQAPQAAEGLTVAAFARDLDHPRWLLTLPNGDVLVAESAAPAQADPLRTGLEGWLMKRVMKKAGSAVTSANRITLLRDADGDGVAEFREVFLRNLDSPFGMALVGEDFYVANTDAVWRFPYHAGETHIAAAGTRLAGLPGGARNHHWTRSLVASVDGRRLYVGVGSNSNVGEGGMEYETGRAAIWEIDRHTGSHRVFATGLRNPVGLAWEPVTGALWTSVNERDELGGDLVPDYMTSVRDGGFYGWPYSYFGQHIDARPRPARPDLVATAIAPDYALGAHTASLGLASARGNRLGAPYGEGMFVGQHGSWNRRPTSGYAVIFLPFAGGRPAGPPREVLTGFRVGNDVRGRPVGVLVDALGALLVADDVGNVVWRVSKAR